MIAKKDQHQNKESAEEKAEDRDRDHLRKPLRVKTRRAKEADNTHNRIVSSRIIKKLWQRSSLADAATNI